MGQLVWTGLGIILAIIAIYSVIQVSSKQKAKQ